jgi:Uma2 family endonuclease
VDEYEQMGRAGIFGEGDRVELLEGEIVEMAPIGPPHASIVDRLTRLLVRAAGDDAIVRVQNPVVVVPHSEPQPDMVVARFRKDFYSHQHPAPEDTLLVIEVADSSLAVDRGVKLPIYARAGVPEVWIVDVGEGAVLTHRTPVDGRYAQAVRYEPGEAVPISALSGVSLAVDDILG